MVEEPENLTIRLLQEIRIEMGQLREQVDEMRADLSNRIDGNTLLLNMVAGIAHDHEQRIDTLEKSRS